MPKTVSVLESELEEARARCLRAEQDGAEISERFGALVDERDAEILRLETELAEAGSDSGGDGAECEKLRRKLVAYRVALTWALWLAFLVPSPRIEETDKRLMFLTVVFPVLDYFTAKSWRRFKHRVGWRNVLDNDIVRRFQER